MAGAPLSAFSNRRTTGAPLERVSENMPRRTLPHTAAVDPLPALVDDRFRVLKQCPVCDDGDDEEVFDRRLDQAQRRIRRLDERIVRTVARPRYRASSPSSASLLRSMKQVRMARVAEAVY